MNPGVLPSEAWTVVKMLASANMLESWVLAGGTGLALQLGHRVSLDLDFFSERGFDATDLRAALAQHGKLVVQAQDSDTLHVLLDGVRLSYLRAEVPFLFSRIEYRGLRIADVRDIAAMKMIAVAGRGSRKDFIDLYAYLEAGGEFAGLVDLIRRRYANTSFNEVHLLRSLVYFKDAELEPMPRMLHKVEWKEVRTRLEEEAKRWAP